MFQFKTSGVVSEGKFNTLGYIIEVKSKSSADFKKIGKKHKKVTEK